MYLYYGDLWAFHMCNMVLVSDEKAEKRGAGEVGLLCPIFRNVYF